MNSQLDCSELEINSFQEDRLGELPPVEAGVVRATGYASAVRTLPLGLLLLCLLAVSSSGCAVCQYAKRTTLNEPSAYWWWGDRKRSVKVYRSWATQAWTEYAGDNCGNSMSEAYETGFKDGFVDYVFAGGTGEPPPVPPRKYWNVGVRSSDAAIEAQEWFAGYRAGALIAHNEGYRERTIVPASLFYESDLSCWEDQPCFERPCSDEPQVTPLHGGTSQEIDHRLPAPQQFQVPEVWEEVSPKFPADQSQGGGRTGSESLEAESLPNPEDSQRSGNAPAIDDLQRQPDSIDRSRKPSSPKLPESDDEFEDVFDMPAASLDSAKATRIRQVNYSENLRDSHHEVSGKHNAVAEFAAAMRKASASRSRPRNAK